MKKNVLMKSKRMAAFALSLSMILGEGAMVGATEVNVDADQNVVSESTEQTAETEVLADTEGAETTDAVSAGEATEQTAPEAENPADESVPAADESAPVAEEAVQEEETETTEEETESADLEEETEELGAYNGTPSKVIGLEGENYYDEDGRNGEGIPVGNDKYVSYNYVNRTESVDKPGDLTKTKDPATGLYNVDGKSYTYASYYRSEDYTSFYNEVAAILPAAPTADPTTGLYVVDGVYYAGYNTGSVTEADGSNVVKSYVVTKGNEVMPVGAAADLAAGQQLAGAVDTNGDTVPDYYVVNGKSYKEISSRAGYYYVYNEISFDKVRPAMKWNRLTTENIEVSGDKEIKIGYQVKVNDAVETSANILAVSSNGEAMAIHDWNSATLNTLVGPGESAKVQVRGVYYVENKTKDAENRDVTTYTAVAAGEWSEAYNFTRAELKEVPQIGGLTAALDGTQIKLTWNPVKEAGSTYLRRIDSKVALTNITSENFEKYYTNDLTEEERKALFGDTSYWSNITTDYDYVDGSSTTVSYNREYTYHYFALKTFGTASNEYKDNTTYSNVAVVTTTKDANIPQVTGFKAEKKSDGSYDLVWNPVDANVVIYAYEKQALPEFFNRDLLNATTVPETTTDEDGDTYTRYTSLEDKLTFAQNRLIEKVQSQTVRGLNGDNGVNTKDDFNLKSGVTYYFTAYTYDDINRSVDQAPIATIDGVNFVRYTNFGPASAVVKVKNDLGKDVEIDTKASKNSIKLTLSGGGNPTGYQIYRQNSKKKWKKIATITDDVYTDADLKENTKYSYRVRAYSYNKDTKKTTYSDYAYKTVSTTQVTNIAVKVTLKSTSQAKVTWSKVGKAEKYEIYRSNSSNVDPKTISKKYKNAGDYAQALENEKFELVKTVKKAKTTSYTDKKLKAGETYTYVVMAYYKDGKTTGYISDSDYVELAVHTPWNVQTENKGTSAKITWDADKFASKFEVRYTLYNKYGEAKSRKATVKTTKNNSYTIKGLESGGYARVEVRAYGKNKTYSGWTGATNTTSLKAAGSITAKNTTEKLTNGKTNNVVKISWKKVSNAKYYKVYRSTKTAVYNKDEKKYVNQGTLIAKESNNDENNDEVYYKEYLGISGAVTGTSAIDRAQLDEGVTYYYSVVAFGEKDTEIASYVTTTGSKKAYATGKPASVVYKADIKISSLKNSKKGQVVVKYNKVTKANQYVIYRADKKNGTYKKLGTSKKTSYTDKTAKKGKTYYYKVVATGTNGAKANMEVTSSVKKIKVKK